MKSPLLSLYASVLVPIYSEWISNEDLCFLDTAVCSQELRNRFLDLLTLSQVVDAVRDDAKSLDWMVLRGLRVQKLVVSTWSPLVESLIQSKHLSSLEIGLDDLELHQEQIIRLNIINIVVTVPNSFDASKWKVAGPVITELSMDSLSDENVNTIAAFCPDLKRVYVSCYISILPLVDACQLDEINGCNVGSLFKREKCDWTYTCKLKRTYEDNDESAVCLGERKYYHMTKLWCYGDMTEEDEQLLIPLMPHLTVFDDDGSGYFYSQLTSAAVQKCHKLTVLDVCNSMLIHELIRLLQQSPLLRRLDFETDDNTRADDCIAVMSKCCPLLEVCDLKGCIVEAESVMSALFSKCHYLTEFDATQWPFEALLSFAVNCESLVLGPINSALKSGRGLRTLTMPNHWKNKKFVHALLSQNPDLRAFKLANYDGAISSSVLDIVVQCCPLLTSLEVWLCDNTQGTSLVPLGRLLHLKSLDVFNVKGITVNTLSAMLENKSTSLLSLTLNKCNLTSGMVTVITRLCPALTSLNLSNNKDIQDADILSLLLSCTKLEVLSLQGCRSVTSAILASVRSPPMKALHALRSGIDINETTDIEYVKWDKS